MTRLKARLPALHAAMVSTAVGGPVHPDVADEVGALIRAISRKARFAQMHWEVLSGIDWEKCDDLGRRPDATSEPLRLRVELSEAFLMVEHSTAVIDHAYLAFDGLTAALVNMTDTLGRALKLAYSLNLPQRQSSLFAIRTQCNPASPLGSVLHDPRYTEWLSKVRELRDDASTPMWRRYLLVARGRYPAEGNHTSISFILGEHLLNPLQSWPTRKKPSKPRIFVLTRPSKES